MRPTNWDRLQYNLSFSNAVILYSDTQDPLVRYLSDIQDEYHLSYHAAPANADESIINSKIIQQLFHQQSIDAEQSLSRLIEQYDHEQNRYLVVLKGLPTDSCINQLLQCILVFSDRFKLILELQPNDALQFIDNYPSQTVSFIGPIGLTHHAAALEQGAGTSNTMATDTNRKQARFHYKKYFVWIGLGLACGLLAFLLLYGLNLLKSNKQEMIAPKANTEEKVGVNIEVDSVVEKEGQLTPKLDPTTANKTESDSLNREPELDFVDKAISQQDMTAAEYFALNRQKESKINNSSTTETETEVKAEPNTDNNAVALTTSPSQLLNNKTIEQETVIAPIEKKEVVSTKNQLDKDASPIKLSYDNAWFIAQAKQSYVIQLSLVSSKAVLDEYLLNNPLAEQIKVYQTNQAKLGVTLGIYESHQAASQAILALPNATQKSGAFAKRIDAIIKQLANKTEF